MVMETFVDVKFFMYYFFYYQFLFTLLYYVLECEPGHFQEVGEPEADYRAVNKILATFIMTFRNSIGDLKAPDYEQWI